MRLGNRLTFALLLSLALGCGDDDSSDGGVADAGSDATDGAPDDAVPDTAVLDTGESTDCEAIAATFETLGSANPDLATPEVSARCEDGMVIVDSNAIPDFPYIETSPGLPREFDGEYTFPAEPTLAATTSPVAALGAIAVAINGIPIFGATEGDGGDVLSLGGGFTECGGHNGPTGYHYHTFDVTGSDVCRFSEAEASAGHVLFGYAFDGFPIYSGNFQFSSSYQLTNEALFATDTWAAHTYVEGSGDLDECNGRMDESGTYAYYTTDTFPYTVGCYRGTPTEQAGGGGGGPGMP